MRSAGNKLDYNDGPAYKCKQFARLIITMTDTILDLQHIVFVSVEFYFAYWNVLLLTII